MPPRISSYVQPQILRVGDVSDRAKTRPNRPPMGDMERAMLEMLPGFPPPTTLPYVPQPGVSQPGNFGWWKGNLEKWDEIERESPKTPLEDKIVPLESTDGSMQVVNPELQKRLWKETEHERDLRRPSPDDYLIDLWDRAPEWYRKWFTEPEELVPESWKGFFRDFGERGLGVIEGSGLHRTRPTLGETLTPEERRHFPDPEGMNATEEQAKAQAMWEINENKRVLDFYSRHFPDTAEGREEAFKAYTEEMDRRLKERLGPRTREQLIRSGEVKPGYFEGALRQLLGKEIGMSQQDRELLAEKKYGRDWDEMVDANKIQQRWETIIDAELSDIQVPDEDRYLNRGEKRKIVEGLKAQIRPDQWKEGEPLRFYEKVLGGRTPRGKEKKPLTDDEAREMQAQINEILGARKRGERSRFFQLQQAQYRG